MKSKTKARGGARKARKNLREEFKNSLKELIAASSDSLKYIEHFEDEAKKEKSIIHETRLSKTSKASFSHGLPPEGPPSDILKKIKATLRAFSVLEISTDYEYRGGETKK